MFPRSNIWQGLRSDLLNAFPKIHGNLATLPRSLTAWRYSGSYAPDSYEGRKYTFTASIDDLSGALIFEVSALLDHMAEHRAAIFRASHGDVPFSGAWLAVTIYYWSFFSALAFSRLIGKPLIFLEKEDVENLIVQHFNSGGGGGTYQIKCGPEISAVQRQITISKSQQSRLHDAVWTAIANDINGRVRSETNREEERMYRRLSVNYLDGNLSWPSTLRNKVNYKAGFAYKLLREGAFSKQLSEYIRSLSPANIGILVDEHENMATSIRGVDINDAVLEYCKTLYCHAVLLDKICNELYVEVADWLNVSIGIEERNAYLSLQMGRPIWPFNPGSELM